MGHEVRTGSLEPDLQARGEKHTANDGPEDQQRGAPFSGHQQIDARWRERDGQNRVAAKAGDIASRFLQPARTERVGEILRVAQGEEEKLSRLASLLRGPRRRWR